jgi:hypothetical protein
LSEELLEKEFEEGELENLKSELEKIIKKLKFDLVNISYEEKSKVIQKLVSK